MFCSVVLRVCSWFLVIPVIYLARPICWSLEYAGITSVSVAAHKGREEIVKMLIAAGADVNIESNNGSTPLIQASHFGRSPAFSAVSYPARFSIWVFFLELLRTRISCYRSCEIDEAVLSPLLSLYHLSHNLPFHLTARPTTCHISHCPSMARFGPAGHAGVVKLLVKANALVDKANQKGTTALMRATQEGNEEVVRILVAAGADVSKRNNERMNALMLGSQVRSVLFYETFVFVMKYLISILACLGCTVLQY